MSALGSTPPRRGLGTFKKLTHLARNQELRVGIARRIVLSALSRMIIGDSPHGYVPMRVPANPPKLWECQDAVRRVAYQDGNADLAKARPDDVPPLENLGGAREGLARRCTSPQEPAWLRLAQSSEVSDAHELVKDLTAMAEAFLTSGGQCMLEASRTAYDRRHERRRGDPGALMQLCCRVDPALK